jgi:hypothetical protein
MEANSKNDESDFRDLRVLSKPFVDGVANCVDFRNDGGPTHRVSAAILEHGTPCLAFVLQ